MPAVTHLLAAAGPWWPHLFSWPRFLDPVSWTWLSVKAYAFSSSGQQISIPLALVVIWRAHNCHGRWWCPFIARHPTADGQHKLCGLHHPDIQRRRLPLEEIHRRHHQAKREKERCP